MKRKPVPFSGHQIILNGIVSLFVMVIVSCGGGIPAQKGNLSEAPNITLEKVIARYRHIDSSSIKWEVVADQNRNEFTKVSMNFDEDSLIIFETLQEMVIKGSFDAESAVFIEDAFYKDLFWDTELWGTEIEGLTYTEAIYHAYFEPDTYNRKIFFNQKGGRLTIYFKQNPSASATYDIIDARLQINFESPLFSEDEMMPYSATIKLGNEEITRMLLENIDFLKAADLF